jgi:hypothetical protein
MSNLAIDVALPPLQSKHRGRWRPIFLEPIVNSGERLCVGVVATDDTNCIVQSVEGLDRLSQIYGSAAGAFTWAARLALREIQHQVSVEGFDSLSIAPEIDGLLIGEVRPGAGTGLGDLARVALQQVASLASEAPSTLALEQIAIPRPLASGQWGAIERRVKQQLTAQHPESESLFGMEFKPSQTARPIRFGFVGSHIVANFSSLAGNPVRTASRVDQAKARMWDLDQLREGVLADLFQIRANSRGHELLVLSPQGRAAKNEIGAGLPEIIEAEEELEAEAGKYGIGFWPLPSIELIAARLSAREFGSLALQPHQQ